MLFLSALPGCDTWGQARKNTSQSSMSAVTFSISQHKACKGLEPSARAEVALAQAGAVACVFWDLREGATASPFSFKVVRDAGKPPARGASRAMPGSSPECLCNSELSQRAADLCEGQSLPRCIQRKLFPMPRDGR